MIASCKNGKDHRKMNIIDLPPHFHFWSLGPAIRLIQLWYILVFKISSRRCGKMVTRFRMFFYIHSTSNVSDIFLLRQCSVFKKWQWFLKDSLMILVEFTYLNAILCLCPFVHIDQQVYSLQARPGVSRDRWSPRI